MRNELKAAREAIPLTMTRAAAEAGIDVTYWSHIEKGRKTPSPEIMARIADVVKVEVTKLFRELRGQGGTGGGQQVAS